MYNPSPPSFNGNNLQIGDVLVTKTPYRVLVHFATYFERLDQNGNKVGYIADFAGHSDPFAKNELSVIPYEEYKKVKKVLRIIQNPDTLRTTNQDVEDAITKYNSEPRPYHVWKYNCGQFAESICKCSIGLDQRIICSLLFVAGILGIVAIFKVIRR